MDYMTELAAIAKTYGGIIETKIAAQRGISKAMLYKLCKATGGKKKWLTRDWIALQNC